MLGAIGGMGGADGRDGGSSHRIGMDALLAVRRCWALPGAGWPGMRVLQSLPRLARVPAGPTRCGPSTLALPQRHGLPPNPQKAAVKARMAGGGWAALWRGPRPLERALLEYAVGDVRRCGGNRVVRRQPPAGADPCP